MIAIEGKDCCRSCHLYLEWQKWMGRVLSQKTTRWSSNTHQERIALKKIPHQPLIIDWLQARDSEDTGSIVKLSSSSRHVQPP